MFNYASKVKLNCARKLIPFLFLSGFSFTDTEDSQDGRGREETIFYSTLPPPPAHKHLGIYLFYSTLSLPPAHKHLGIYLNFAFEMTITYFSSHHLFLPGCYSMSFSTLSNYHFIWLMMWHYFLFIYLMIWY